MKWRDPNKEIPENGDIVAVLYQHPKKHKYMSSQIMFGEFIKYSGTNTSGFVHSGYFTGTGSWGCYLGGDPSEYADRDFGIAWMPAIEFVMPEWTPHDPWWGKI